MQLHLVALGAQASFTVVVTCICLAFKLALSAHPATEGYNTDDAARQLKHSQAQLSAALGRRKNAWPDETSLIWCNKAVLLVNTTLRCVFIPQRKHQPVLAVPEALHVALPKAQGRVAWRRTSAARVTHGIHFSVVSARPRLVHPCGSLDFEVSVGRLRFGGALNFSLLGTGKDAFEKPYQTAPREFTLAVSECFGSLQHTYEAGANSLLAKRAIRPLLAKQRDASFTSSPSAIASASAKASKLPGKRPQRRGKSSDRKALTTTAMQRGDVHVVDHFLTPEEVRRFLAWEERCERTVERSDEKNIGEKCLTTGCVAYCGLWQMVSSGSEEDLVMFLNVTRRAAALLNDAQRLFGVTAYEYQGNVWPHWATFQHYLPGGRHILHPDTDKGEHCLSLAASFSSHGQDFGGGKIQVFQCPPTVPDCGNRGVARTYVPMDGGPYVKRWPNGSSMQLAPGEWLWDGEPEASYPVQHVLSPMAGRAVVWLSETVHQVKPVTWGTRRSLFYWFTCKEPLQNQAFDWSGYAERYL